MLNAICIAATIIGSFVGNVNAASAPVEQAGFEAFGKHLLEKGGDENLHEGNAKDLDLKPGQALKATGTDPEESTDGLDRNAYLALHPETKKPTHYLFLACRNQGTDSDCHWFRYSVKGKLDISFRNQGKNNADGTAVRGSAKITKLKPSAPDVKAKAQRELEFWLKGMHRTKLGTLRLTNPDATQADVEAAEKAGSK
jgi:hypothetical protein